MAWRRRLNGFELRVLGVGPGFKLYGFCLKV